MAIKLIHVSDIHFGSGESHGRINPETGLNVRFEDFVGALERVVDFALANDAEIFLFSGDAYRNASPEPVYQKMFARQLRRLSAAGIKTVLVVGNHDQILRSSGSHAMSVFQSLEVPGVLTVDRPLFERIETRSGPVQLIGLPHITRQNLMTLERYAGATAAQIDQVLVERAGEILRGFYEELDPAIPSVVTAHMSLDRAVAGIEEELLVGYTLTFPAELFVDDRVDYVALGHIHKHQVIRQADPAIVYAGSLERVDFGEEKEDKGFVFVRLERRQTSFEFHSIEPRRFITVDVDVAAVDEPVPVLIERLQQAVEPGCVLRLRYKIAQDNLHKVDERALAAACNECLTARFLPEVVSAVNRGRLPELTESSASAPMKALETYLDEVAPERKERLIQRAAEVMRRLDADLHNGDGRSAL